MKSKVENKNLDVLTPPRRTPPPPPPPPSVIQGCLRFERKKAQESLGSGPDALISK